MAQIVLKKVEEKTITARNGEELLLSNETDFTSKTQVIMEPGTTIKTDSKAFRITELQVISATGKVTELFKEYGPYEYILTSERPITCDKNSADNLQFQIENYNVPLAGDS